MENPTDQNKQCILILSQHQNVMVNLTPHGNNPANLAQAGDAPASGNRFDARGITLKTSCHNPGVLN